MSEKQALKDRYSPEFIARAEERRTRMNLHSIRVGQKTGPEIQRVLDLLYQAHQSHYFGYFESTATLCGVLLEQCLFTLLTEAVSLRGSITVRLRGQTVVISNMEDLRTVSLYQMTGSAIYYAIIPADMKDLAVELRLIRNQLMHFGFPVLRDAGTVFEAEVPTNPHDGLGSNLIVSIPAQDARDHCLTGEDNEIWSWYILTRTRDLMSAIFRARVTRLPPIKLKPDDPSAEGLPGSK